MACGIYKITNLVNHRVYIGQSVDIKRRWRAERAAAFSEKSSCYNTALSKAFRKYCTRCSNGRIDFSNFSFEILEECSVESLNAREQFYVAKFDAYLLGYNMTEGGDTPHKQILDKNQLLQIIKCLKEDLHKSSEQIGAEFNISGRMVRNINNGSCHRLDTVEYPIRPLFISHPRNVILRGEKIAKTVSTKLEHSKCPALDTLFKQIYETSFTTVGKLYGVSSTAVQKWLKRAQVPTKIKDFKRWYQTEVLKELPVSENQTTQHRVIKPVAQYSLENEYIQTFPSLNQAALSVTQNNYGSVHIREVCTGKRKSAYGYYWQFI